MRYVIWCDDEYSSMNPVHIYRPFNVETRAYGEEAIYATLAEAQAVLDDMTSWSDDTVECFYFILPEGKHPDTTPYEEYIQSNSYTNA